MKSAEPPCLAADPHFELAAALERAVQLQEELLKVHQRIRELNEQVIQRRPRGGADDKREDSAQESS